MPAGTVLLRASKNCEENVRIKDLAIVLAERGTDFCWIKSSVVANCYFELRRIWAARHKVFVRVSNLENGSGSDFENAVRVMESVNRYEIRARSKDSVEGLNTKFTIAE